MESRPCPACQKTVLPMDEKVTAEGGVFHRPCFKCTECKCQLTLLNFAAIKGTVYCKPHFVQLFKLRGKYDDMDGSSKKGGDEAEATATAAVEAAAAVVVAPVVVAEPEPVAAPAPAPVAVAVEGATAGRESTHDNVFISGLSVKERIEAARKAEAAHTTPTSGSSEPRPSRRLSVTKTTPTAGVHQVTSPAEASSSGAGAKASPAAVAVAVTKPVEVVVVAAEKAKSVAEPEVVAAAPAAAGPEVFITGLSVKDRIAARKSIAPASGLSSTLSSSSLLASASSASTTAASKGSPSAGAAPAPVTSSPLPAAATVTPKVSPKVSPKASPLASEETAAKPKAASKVIPGLGGGGSKCADCGKMVYSADPSFANDGCIWHRECFKCTKCKGNLTIKTMAAINGQLYCKPHFIEIFKLKGTYDSFAKEEAKEVAADVPAVAAT